MSLFEKLAKFFSGDKSEGSRTLAKELALLKREGRMHSRHVLHGRPLISLTLKSGAIGPVRDVSFGGLGVIFPSSMKDRIPTTMTPNECRLRILDRELTLKMTPVHWLDRGEDGVFVGFRIQHETPASLVTLRELIDPLKWGGSLVPMAKEIRHDRYKSDAWMCLHGEGPTDLILKRSVDQTQIEEALLTFRIGANYCDVSLKDGRLATSLSTGEPESGLIGAGSSMAGTPTLDKAVLRSAVCILLGAPSSARQSAEPLIEKLLLGLDVKSTTTAA